MRPSLPLALVALLLSSIPASFASNTEKRSYDTHDYFVLEHDPSAGLPLNHLLVALNLELVEQVGQLRNHWLLRTAINERKRRRDTLFDPLDSLSRLLRSRRDQTGFVASSHDNDLFRLLPAVKHFSQQKPRRRIKRTDLQLRAPPEINNDTSAAVAKRLDIVDPTFHDQWHLVNDEFPSHSVNVAPVWDMGITGEGIIAAMVDDGLDYESDDLAANFDAVNSYDFNLHVPLPKPVLFDDHHGTRCAGQIAAVKNDACGVGIAYNSKVAGIRILSGPISDVDEAAALNYGFQNTSIYSCSWGPADDGRSMEGPSYLIQKAVVNGIQNGRDGKGSVFVFASGNGAAQGDQCNFDGYTNSIYSVTVAAVDYKGLHPYYSEACAANMVVTYSSGSGKHIVTTDVGENKCSFTHGGTSAAAPNAVGIFTLALSARPDLTWRDIQHLCVRTAKMINPDDPDWETTAAGRRFSYKYGYGSLDALAYVTAARKWEVVKPQGWLETEIVQLGNGTMTVEGEFNGGEAIVSGGVTSATTITRQMLSNANFESLEHVTVRVWISHSRRGDVEVDLVSPSGVKSVLAGRRKYDQDTSGYPGWIFMTVKHWDENPIGDWTVHVKDQESEDDSGSFLGWSMTLWGSVIDPAKAQTFVLADPDVPFPPIPSSTSGSDGQPATTASPSSAASTKVLPKPTAHLPGDHGSAEGEADKPAFTSAQEDAAQPTSSSALPTESLDPTADEGWFPGMYNLMSNSKWVFGAIGVVVLFALSAAAFFLWRRRSSRLRKGKYKSLAANEVAMDTIERTGRHVSGGTRELYDAFGEVSEDDEFDDEETGLRRPLTRGEGLQFHSDFLDDDTDRPDPLYSDEPQSGPPETEHGRGPAAEGIHDGSKSPTVASADGSWEHASIS